MSQHTRLTLIRRAVTKDDAPLPVRVTACVMLLYAQPLTRTSPECSTELEDSARVPASSSDNAQAILIGNGRTPCGKRLASAWPLASGLYSARIWAIQSGRGPGRASLMRAPICGNGEPMSSAVNAVATFSWRDQHCRASPDVFW
jgi:hypothetical protein